MANTRLHREVDSVTRVTYTVSEADFKEALGIEDAERVLQVDTDWRADTVIIRMEKQRDQP